MRTNTDFSHQIAFDKDAELYERGRPTYPPDLFEKIKELGQLTKGAHILEVGCGTGQATKDLANLGSGPDFQVVALEPGPNMARLALEKFKNTSAVQIHNAYFESWETDQKFNAIISANAWHWVEPDKGYEKAAWLLKPGGLFAAFWNVAEIADPQKSEKIEKLVNDLAPEAAPLACLSGTIESAKSSVQAGLEDHKACGFFKDVTLYTITQDLRLGPRDFIDWICSYSNVQALAPPKLENLKSALEGQIRRWDAIPLTNQIILRTGTKP